MKAVFFRGDILSREYLLVPKSTSALSRFPKGGLARGEKKGGEREKDVASPTRLKHDGYVMYVCAKSA